MAKILSINGPFYEISNMANEAKSFLLLISPYVNISSYQFRDLKVAARRGVEITIVFRDFESSDDVFSRCQFIDDTFELPNLKIISCPDLHAKLYIDERRAVITSRNLYERKEGSSIEVGVRFYKGVDDKMYDGLLDLAKEITQLDNCEIIVDNTKTGRKRKIPRHPQYGFCISCRGQIPFNPDKPYCDCCFEEWTDFTNGNKKQIERFCHRCGMRKERISYIHPQDEECSFQN